MYQRAHRGGDFASLPGDEYIPGRAFIGNRNDHHVRYVQMRNEHWFQGDGVFVAKEGKAFRKADQRLAGALLFGRTTRHNSNPRGLGEFELAEIFAARSAGAKGSLNLGRSGGSHDT